MSDEAVTKTEEVVKTPAKVLTPEELQARLDDLNAQYEAITAVKADFKSRKEEIPAEINKEAMKIRRNRRNVQKKLGIFVPVSDRPRKEPAVKANEVDFSEPDGKPARKAKKKAAAEAAAAVETESPTTEIVW